MSKMLNRHKGALIYSFLVVSTLAVYHQVLYSDFVNYDDPEYVTENQHIKAGLTWESVWWAFTTRRCSNWHPLTWLSLMLDYQLFGERAATFHIINLLFHLANTLLLFGVLRLMTGSVWRSALVAAFFAVHPLHVESVAWVSERKDVLSTLFWLLTMWAYASYAHRGGVGRYLLTLLLFVLGLMAKPMLVTVPIVMLLLDYWPLSRLKAVRPAEEIPAEEPNRKNTRSKESTLLTLLWEKVPFFVLAAASSLITLVVQKKGGAVTALDVIDLNTRICNALVSYAVYIIKTFMPTGLAVFYPHPQAVPLWHVAGAVSLLVFIFVAVLAARRSYFTFGWLWYIITLIPVIGLVQVGSQARADRYMYVPMIGLLIMTVWGVAELAAKWRLQKLKFLMVFSTGLCLSAMMICTWLQVRHWHNGYTLFTRALEVTSNNYIAHLNLGNVLLKAKKADKAIAHYDRAIAIHRDYVDAHFNLGVALSLEERHSEAIEEYYTVLRLQKNHKQVPFRLADALAKNGQLDEAITYYNKALEQDTTDAKIHNNLGLALVKKGRIDEATEHYIRALEASPNSVEVLNNLGNALVKQKKFTQAVAHYQKVLSLKPHFAEAHYNLANALKEMGEIDEAAICYQEALRLKPDDIDAHYGLGLVLARLKRYGEAATHFKKAIQLNPDFAQAYYQLGIILFSQNETGKAIEQFREVLRIHRDDAQMHCNLGILLIQEGRVDEAIEEFRTAIRLDPNFTKAREQLEAALAERTAPRP